MLLQRKPDHGHLQEQFHRPMKVIPLTGADVELSLLLRTKPSVDTFAQIIPVIQMEFQAYKLKLRYSLYRYFFYPFITK